MYLHFLWRSHVSKYMMNVSQSWSSEKTWGYSYRQYGLFVGLLSCKGILCVNAWWPNTCFVLAFLNIKELETLKTSLFCWCSKTVFFCSIRQSYNKVYIRKRNTYFVQVLAFWRVLSRIYTKSYCQLKYSERLNSVQNWKSNCDASVT